MCAKAEPSYMEKKTIIVISHRASSIQNAEKIIALDQGGLLYEGPAGEFFNRDLLDP